MSLGKCKECGAEVSDHAKTCPKCGVEKPVKAQKRPMSKITKFFLIGLGVLFVAGLIASGFQQGARDDAEAKRVAAMTPDQRDAEAKAKTKIAADAATKKTADEKTQAAAEASRRDVGMAEAACQVEAERRANDPSSVQWIRDERQFGYTSSDKTRATSLQPMRAKNKMGGLARTAVRCDLVKQKDSWTVAKLTELH